MISLTVRMSCSVEQACLHIEVEPAVAIVIAESRHPACVNDSQTARRRLFLERAVPLVDEQQVRSSKTAHVKVQPAVVIHIDERGALLPRRARRARESCFRGDVLEFPIAEIAE